MQRASSIFDDNCFSFNFDEQLANIHPDSVPFGRSTSGEHISRKFSWGSSQGSVARAVSLARCGSLPDPLVSFPDLNSCASNGILLKSPLEQPMVPSFLPITGLKQPSPSSLPTPKAESTGGKVNQRKVNQTSPESPSLPPLEGPLTTRTSSNLSNLSDLSTPVSSNHPSPPESPRHSLSSASSPFAFPITTTSLIEGACVKVERVGLESSKKRDREATTSTHQKMKMQTQEAEVSSSVLTKNHASTRPDVENQSNSSDESDTIMNTRVKKQTRAAKKNASDTAKHSASLAASRPRRNVKRVVYKDAPDLDEDDSVTEDEQRESIGDDDDYASSGFSSSSSNPSRHSREKKRTKKRSAKKSGGTSRISKESACKRERNKISAANYRKRRKVYIDNLESNNWKLSSKCATLKTKNKRLKQRVKALEAMLMGGGKLQPGSSSSGSLKDSSAVKVVAKASSSSSSKKRSK